MSNDNTINGLRNIMFETLRGIKDGSVDIDKAKAINDTAQTIINSAKVEVDFVKATGQSGTGNKFLGLEEGSQTATGSLKTSRDPATGITSTVHRMR